MKLLKLILTPFIVLLSYYLIVSWYHDTLHFHEWDYKTKIVSIIWTPILLVVSFFIVLFKE